VIATTHGTRITTIAASSATPWRRSRTIFPKVKHSAARDQEDREHLEEGC
jgi:hypothetical protein